MLTKRLQVKEPASPSRSSLPLPCPPAPCARVVRTDSRYVGTSIPSELEGLSSDWRSQLIATHEPRGGNCVTVNDDAVSQM